MVLQAINPTKTKAWKQLQNHFEVMQKQSIKTLFTQNPNRAQQFHIHWDDFLVDYSKMNLTLLKK